MLTAMRSGAGSKVIKFVIFSFLVLAVAGLALMDVGGFFQNGSARNDTVATVAGQKINGADFDRAVRRAVNQQGLSDINMAYKLGLVNQYLNNQISGALTQRAASDNGILVDNKVIAERLAELVAPYTKDGMTTDEALRRILMAQGLTEPEFIAMMRSELTQLMIRGSLQNAGLVSEAEVKDLYQQRHEQRTAKIIVLSNDSVEGAEAATDEVLKPFYQAGQEKYAVPETRVFTVALLTEAAARKALDVSDEEVQQMYKDRLDEYTEKEKRQLQQALFTTEADAKAAHEKVKAGASLKDAAGASYIGEEGFEESGLPKEIAEPAFALEKGETTDPIKTSLGWHVLTMKDTIAAKVKPFESVKEAIKKDLIEEKAANQLVETSNQLDDALAGGQSLEDAAKDFHLELKKIGPVRQDGSTADSKDGMKDFAKSRGEILEVAYSLQPEEISSVQELPDGTYAVIQVDTVTPKTYKEFESVKAELAKTWAADQQDVLNRRRATDLLQAVQSGNKTMEDAAKDVGASVKTVTLSNAKPAEAPVTDALKQQLFGNDKGTFQLSPAKDAYILATVTSVSMPDADKASKADLDAVREEAQKMAENEIFAVYFAQLQEKYGVKINQNVLDKMYTQNAEQQL